MREKIEYSAMMSMWSLYCELEHDAAEVERGELLDKARKADEEAQDAMHDGDEDAYEYWSFQAQKFERRAETGEPTYEERVAQLEQEGCCTSDAQAVAEAEGY